jgi:hypothetical protein
MGGACDTITEVTEYQVTDGRIDVTDYIRPYYHCFVILFVLGCRSILVF